MADIWLWERERLVYEGEGWGIIVDDARPKTYATHEACTVSHRSGEVGSSYGAMCWDGTGSKCILCKETVPDGIQGLILMLNWEKYGD